jgi:hypothetical protein
MLDEGRGIAIDRMDHHLHGNFRDGGSGELVTATGIIGDPVPKRIISIDESPRLKTYRRHI